jgi:hypothetical protein
MMPTPAADKGVLYVAIGERMRQPLVRSIASVRKHLDLPITLITDLRDLPYVEAFVSVDWKGSPGYAVKPALIPELPYHRTMFLDTDTVIMRSDAAKPLDLITQRYGYHAAAVHGISRRFAAIAPKLGCVPSFNSGVLFLRRSPPVKAALQRWRDYYPGSGSEETYLTQALLHERVPTYCLPYEWNYRGRRLDPNHKIRILHKPRTGPPSPAKPSLRAIAHRSAPRVKNLRRTDFALITTHFNPQRYRRLKETYYQWRPTIKAPVICYEMVLGGAAPEIDGSVVIRGSHKNLLWQKERLINLAIEQLPDHVRYVGWLDHDMMFENSNWLAESIDKLRSGADAVQPFDRINYLDLCSRVIFTQSGAVANHLQGKTHQSCPGAAWLATRKFLREIGGLYDRNAVDGGDNVWFSGLTGHKKHFLQRQPAAVQRDERRWMESIIKPRVGYVPGTIQHLWHGDRKNRQYVSRDPILCEFNVDPASHLTIESNGLLAWTPAAPAGLRNAVRDYFAARCEDG